jgi:hypothetical protein
MENAFLGYVSGREKVTEEDAFTLVREHFGDPGLVKDLLRGAHAVEAPVGFLRLLGAVVAASLGASIIGVLLYAFTVTVLSPIQPGLVSAGLPEVVRTFMLFILPEGAQSWIPALLMLGVLLYWRARMMKGDRLWFLTIKRGYFQMIILFLFAAVQVLGSFCSSEPVMMPTFHNVYSGVDRYNPFGDVFLFGSMALSVIAQCLIWIWWLDRHPQCLRMVFAGVFAWIGYYLAHTVLPVTAAHNISQVAAVAQFFKEQFGSITYLWDTLFVLDIAVISFFLYLSAVCRIRGRKTIPVEIGS